MALGIASVIVQVSRIIVHAPARSADIVVPALRSAASCDVIYCRDASECARAVVDAAADITFANVDDALATTDILFVAVPLAPDTKGLLDRRRLGLLRARAYVVNVARGAVIDEAALVEALRERRLAGAALDVFDEEPLPTTSPLWGLDNVIVSPHVGGLGSDRVHERIVDVCIRNLHAFEAGTLDRNEGLIDR